MRYFSTFVAFLLSLALFQPSASAETIGDVVSRVQTNLNRVAVGLPPIAPSVATNADKLVEAFSVLLAGDAAETARAMRVLDAVDIQASVSLRRMERAYPWPVRDLYARYSTIDTGLRLEPGMQGPDAPWIRFVAVGQKAIDAMARFSDDRAGGSIRIPCAVAGRLALLTIETRELAAFVQSLTDCPEWRNAQEVVILTGPDRLYPYLRMARDRFHDDRVQSISVPQVSPGTPDWARRHIGDHPDEAEAILRASGDVRSRIDYALFLYHFRPESVERDESIRRAISAATQLVLGDGAESYRQRFDPSFVSRMSIDQLVDAFLGMPISNGYQIPCALVVRAPEILVHTEPRYGGGGDAFLPKSDCDLSYPEMSGYPLWKVARYRELAKGAGKYGNQGSIWTAIYVARNAEQYRVQSDPRAFLDSVWPTTRPYETWAYLSISNRAVAREIDDAYEAALAGLRRFYRRLGLNDGDATLAAQNGLQAIVLGPDCGAAPPPASFRKLLLDDAPLDKLRAFNESGQWRNAALLTPFLDCAYYAGIDPLAHIAILDLEKFAYLQALANTLRPDDRQALDLQMDVNAPNAFGKTPLMTALQHRMPEAVSWLMANGADPTAVTDSVSLEFGRRTPLMYAAASGSLAMIQDLLEAGADPLQADTMGRRAVHYLLASGPPGQPPNPALSDDELRIAYELLR